MRRDYLRHCSEKLPHGPGAQLTLLASLTRTQTANRADPGDQEMTAYGRALLARPRGKGLINSNPVSRFGLEFSFSGITSGAVL